MRRGSIPAILFATNPCVINGPALSDSENEAPEIRNEHIRCGFHLPKSPSGSVILDQQMLGLELDANCNKYYLQRQNDTNYSTSSNGKQRGASLPCISHQNPIKDSMKFDGHGWRQLLKLWKLRTSQTCKQKARALSTKLVQHKHKYKKHRRSSYAPVTLMDQG
jgi:hypothetical protein